MTAFPLDRECPYCGGSVAPDLAWCTHCASDMPLATVPQPEALAVKAGAPVESAAPQLPADSEG